MNNIPYKTTFSNTYINYAGIAESPIILASDEYFVLGDNHEYSKDSRYPEVGLINSEDIIGKIYPQIPIMQE